MNYIEKLMFLVGTERSGIVISMTDKKIYFPKSFNEQMAWIDEEIEHIIKYNDKYNIKENIQEKGRATYGEQGYTHTINRLFEIVKSDPKNKAILHEVCKAEQELIAYLYDEPGAWSEEQIYTYWNSYLQSYIAELEAHPIHYILVKGFDVKSNEEDKNEEFLGVYDSIARLQDAYVIALQKLEEQHKNMTGLLGDKVDYIIKHEKVMINAFDEFTGRWYYDMKPEQLFWRQNTDIENFSMVECIIDSPDMCMFKLDKVKKSLSGHVYEDTPSRCQRQCEEMLSVRFDVDYSYEVLGLLDLYWGGWNSTPDARTMQEKAKGWHEKYDAELLRISHDTLTFKCRKMSEKEAKELIEETAQLYALIVDCKPEKLLNHLMENETFTLWWD